ncbi:MAG: carbohydrate binding family 9 domain-containing protein [Acidobacteriota bacterium]|nr:carbohydrate binding family 9 domain-containing protein [Acidobacteriota bacterium]
MSVPEFGVWQRGLVAAVLTAGLVGPAWAQQPPTPGVVTRTFKAAMLPEGAAPPTIDGRVDDEAWQAIEPFGDFIQQDPREGAPATEKTEVRVLMDGKNLYVGVIAYDSDPSKIVFTQSKRDADLTESDSIQVLFDTFNDHQNGFVFGTNPNGVEYDGQVAGEGSTGSSTFGAGTGGSRRGALGAFNANWDADWTVRSQITERGWESEIVIPLKTLRYDPGAARTWGFNVLRNIRRKNEQSYLQPVPRGYNLTQVSSAAQLTGLALPKRRDIKITPYVAGSANTDKRFVDNQNDFTGDVGVDLKWGVTPSLTADLTVNTDFAQVEADDQQVNLTRFELFFPEKRPFFLENSSIFQFGATQQADLFFSRRIGIERGDIVPIIAGGRLSGRAGGLNVGVLNIQTQETRNGRTDALIAPATNFTVTRVQREFGRSNVGAIFVNRQGVGSAAGSDSYNRSYGIDTALQTSLNTKLFAFLAATMSPGSLGTDKAGRVFYTFNRPNLFSGNIGYLGVGERFNPEVGFLPRRGYHFGTFRFALDYQPKTYPYIRRFSPHVFEQWYWGLDGNVQTMRGHYHFLEIQPASGGRWGLRVDREQDRPTTPFTIYRAPGGRTVVIPPGLYSWWYGTAEYYSNPSAPLSFSIVPTVGQFYDGDYTQVMLNVEGRVGSRLTTSVGLTRADIKLPYGDFTTTLVPFKASYSFTPLATLAALVQYNSQSTSVSSNVRLALLNRSGTGLFIVYNDQRDTSPETRSFRGLSEDNLLGRSFIIKYTKLFDF